MHFKSVPGGLIALLLTIWLLLMLQVEFIDSTNLCKIQVDMVIAVDTSTSCTDAEFKKLQAEVKAIASEFPIGPEKARLALIGMSQSAQVLANFNDVNSLSDFNSAVDKLSLTSGRTDISKGMKLARESVLNKVRSAPTSRLLVLVKDRQCDPVTRPMGSTDVELALIKSEVGAVRSMGASVHAVGVGGLWDSQEMNALFGSEYLMFNNKSKAVGSINSFISKVCMPNKCQHLGQSVKLGTFYGNANHVLTANVSSAMNSDGAGVCRQEIARSFRYWSELVTPPSPAQLQRNPDLRDAEAQFKSTSAYSQSKNQLTWGTYKYGHHNKCIKQIEQCSGDKRECIDPTDGSRHFEGESWISMCHEFRCKRDGKTVMPTKTTKCVAADYSCKAIGSAPFQCRNLDGELRENCQCVDKSGEAVLVVESRDST